MTLPVLPEVVEKEIQNAKDHYYTFGLDILFDEHATRIALLAYREGALAGIRETKEAAAKVEERYEPDQKTDYVHYASQTIRSLPEQPILDRIVGEK